MSKLFSLFKSKALFTAGMMAVGVAVTTAGAIVTTEQASYALAFTESGDAGETLGTAQDTTRAFSPGNAIDSISGSVGRNSADLFRIYINGGTGQQFSASTVNDGTNFDTQLFLFDANGRGVIANDDAPGGNFRSSISAFLMGGFYYLGISGYNYDPRSGSTYLFPDTFTGQQTPSTTLALNDWQNRGGSGSPSSGSYRIALTNVNTIPTPALLPGLLAMGVGLLRKRKAQAGVEVEAEA